MGNVDNAYEVHTMAQQYIKQVLPDVHIEVEGVFWDPFKEEMDGIIEITSSQGGKDFALDKVINQPKFREYPKHAVEKALDAIKLQHLAFYGLDVDTLVERFRKYLPLWDDDAAQKGIKLGEIQGEAAKTAAQLKAEAEERQAEILLQARAMSDALGLEVVESEAVDQADAAKTLDQGPVKTGIAKIPEFGLGKAKDGRLKMKEEIEKYLGGEVPHDELSEASRKQFAEEDGKVGAETRLAAIVQELAEIDARLQEIEEKKAKAKAKPKSKAAPAPGPAAKGKGEKGKGTGKGKGKGKQCQYQTVPNDLL